MNNFRGIEKDLKSIEEVLEEKIKDIYVFYDADLVHNGNVFEAAVKLGRYLEKKRSKISVKYVVWPNEYGKGIEFKNSHYVHITVHITMLAR